MTSNLRVLASFLTGAGLLLLLTACAGQQQAPIQYYTISSDTPAEFSLPQPVRVARVGVPDYIDNDRMWMRTQSQQLHHVARARWSEPLGAALTRELNISLGTGLTQNRDHPLLLVTLDRLEAQWRSNGDAVVLIARWALESPGGQSLTRGQLRLHEPLGDRSAESIASAISGLVIAMNQEIGEDLAQYWASQ